MLTMRVCQLAVLTETEHDLCKDIASSVLLVPCTAKQNHQVNLQKAKISGRGRIQGQRCQYESASGEFFALSTGYQRFQNLKHNTTHQVWM